MELITIVDKTELHVNCDLQEEMVFVRKMSKGFCSSFGWGSWIRIS